MSSPDNARCALPDRRAVVDQLCRGEREGSAVRTVSGLPRGQLAVVFSVNPPHQHSLICKAIAMNSQLFSDGNQQKKKKKIAQMRNSKNKNSLDVPFAVQVVQETHSIV